MDRRVKERLVGASILVILIVLIVPELLSGPAPVPAASPPPVIAPEAVRSVTVDLRTSKAQATAPVSDSAAAPGAGAATPAATAPSPADSPVSAAAPAQAPDAAPAVLEKAPPHPSSGAGSATAVSAGHGWAVQLGSFGSHENADKLARRVKSQGFAVYVSPSGSGKSLRYRVRVGPMADRGAANQTAAKLKSMGQTGSVVAPGP
jgi:DedD protein